MNKQEIEFQESFLIIQKNYILKLQKQILRINIIKTELKADPPDENLLKELYQLAHSICGSSAMFNLLRISDIACELESLLKAILNSNTKYTNQYSQIVDLINQLNNKLSELEN
ncbi:MAG: hypothetical protein ACD_20C00108G0005 [uncultured bacterium]|nr:MAG: hypothetical protein ACD_20C00108G0005 [uncultured bacterium]